MMTLCLLAFLLAACGDPGPRPPETRRVDVVDTIHGVEVPDPYRWLEDQDSPETRAFIDAQNAFAETIVGDGPFRERLRTRLSELLRHDAVGSPRRGGDVEYFTLRRGGDELAAIYRRARPNDDAEADAEAEYRPIDPDAEHELVVAPGEVGDAETTHLGILSVSDDGELLLYSVRDGGADEIEVRVRNAASGTDLPDRLPRALYSSLAFSSDGRGFFYVHRSREVGPRARFHELGADVTEDELLFGEDLDPTSFLGIDELAGGELRLFTVRHGWARADLYVQDMASGGPRPLFEGAPARFDPQFHDGRLFIHTNLDAPNNRIVAVDPRRASSGATDFEEIVPESVDVLTGFSILDGKIYASYLHDVSHRIDVLDLSGSKTGEVEIPEHHAAEIGGAGPGKALLTLTSFTRPPTSYLLDLETGARRVVRGPEVDFDTDAFEVEQVRYRSIDGTEIPMYLFHAKGVEPTGELPTLLFGYGGFNVALTPRFDPMAAVWVEEGGLFAMANLRGGSEYGEAWHRAGMLENKQNVFDDFIAAAEYLVDEGYTRSEKLAIRGVSNGGLLVASALTQRPELFRAVLCGFPDLDMVRFHAFTETNNLPALLEYGDASKPAQFDFIRRYSPYQAVRQGTAYPAVMLTSGDLDTRVSPLQARKMTARLQAATSSEHPVILRYHPKAGHAADYGMPVSQTIEDMAMELAFLLGQLSVPSR